MKRTANIKLHISNIKLKTPTDESLRVSIGLPALQFDI